MALHGIAWHCAWHCAALYGIASMALHGCEGCCAARIPGRRVGKAGRVLEGGRGEGQDVLEGEEELPAALFVLAAHVQRRRARPSRHLSLAARHAEGFCRRSPARRSSARWWCCCSAPALSCAGACARCSPSAAAASRCRRVGLRAQLRANGARARRARPARRWARWLRGEDGGARDHAWAELRGTWFFIVRTA